MTNWDTIKATHKPIRNTVRIPMAADLLDQIEQLEQQAHVAREADKMSNTEDTAPAIAARIQELETELAASEVVFVFEAIGGRALNRLVAEHPPTDQQVKDAEKDGNKVLRNEETFQPALLHASCVEPEGSTLEAWEDICENWSIGQFTPLWQACLLANFGAADVGPKSRIASEILKG